MTSSRSRLMLGAKAVHGLQGMQSSSCWMDYVMT
jgi:hypothetical protein